MRRGVFVIAVGGLLAAIAAPGHAATVFTRNRVVNINYSSPTGGLWLIMSQQTDFTGASPTTTSGCVSAYNLLGSDFACGPMTLTMDPLATTGEISAALIGSNGQINVNLAYTASRVGTNPPFAEAEIVPAPSRFVGARAVLTRGGRSNGAVGFGPYSLLVNAADSTVVDFYEAQTDL